MEIGLFRPKLPGMDTLALQLERAFRRVFSADGSEALTFSPGSTAVPMQNGQVTFEMTNDTTLKIKARGSDGVVRVATLTLS